MSNVLEQALYSRLTGTAAITSLLSGTAAIYNSVGPPGADYPAIIFNLQAGTEDNESPHRANQNVYQIKAISLSSFKEAGAIDAQIDLALHLIPLTVTGWTNFWVARESEIRFTEVSQESVRYYHVGGLYRVRLGK